MKGSSVVIVNYLNGHLVCKNMKGFVLRCMGLYDRTDYSNFQATNETDFSLLTFKAAS